MFYVERRGKELSLPLHQESAFSPKVRVAPSVDRAEREKGGSGTGESRQGQPTKWVPFPLGRFYYMYSRLPKTEI